MYRRPPRSPLFPSTTLFRSDRREPLGAGDAEERLLRAHVLLRLADDRAVVGGGVECRDTPARFAGTRPAQWARGAESQDRKSTRLNSSHANISYAVFCLKKK